MVSIPRKKPTEIIEHRISLSDFERKELREYLDANSRSKYLSGAGSLMQGVSWPFLAAAALLWVGFSLDEIIEDVKGFIDNQSTNLKNWVEKRGYINYRADEIGREIYKNQIEIDKYTELMLANAAEAGPNWAKDHAKYKRKLETLSARDKVLREMLADIASGDAEGYDFELHGNMKSGSFEDEYGREGTIFEKSLQDMYVEYGGEGVLDWEMDTDSDQDWTNPDANFDGIPDDEQTDSD